jgi:hypothetical protein
MKLGKYIIAPEPISTLYLINPSLRSVFLYVYLPIVARQQFDKNVTATTNRIKESRRLVLPRTFDLLILNRNQLRWVVGLLTGHFHLKGHLFKLGLTDNPTCERCREKDETTTLPMRL